MNVIGSVCGVCLSEALLKNFAIALAVLALSVGQLAAHGVTFHMMRSVPATGTTLEVRFQFLT